MAGDASAAAAASSSASAAPAVTLTLERFAPGKSQPEGVFQVGDATLVTEGARVGRVVGEGIEPVAEAPGAAGQGSTFVTSVSGRWPDRLDALYVTPGAAEPSYAPLTGGGTPHRAADGGGVQGIVTVGETTLLVVARTRRDVRLVVARGPARAFVPLTREQAGCSPDETPGRGAVASRALLPDSFHATAAGTVIALGMSCHWKFSAEVWGPGGGSRLVDLTDAPRGDGDSPSNQGDEMWVSHSKDLLRYRSGSFELIKGPGVKWGDPFFSARGQLHVYNHEAIYRRDGERWTLVARVSSPAPLRELSQDTAGTFWASSSGDHGKGVRGAVYRLREPR